MPTQLDTHNQLPRINRNDKAIMRFGTEVLASLPYDPNDGQMLLITAFAHFLLYSPQQTVFLLKGYAGTGKTSMTGALVKTMSQNGMKAVLMAPTGRAAKVFTEYSGHTAYTIHRKIYRQQSYGQNNFLLAENKHTNTVFIVDEASMISNSSGDYSVFGTGRLLDDLISYVYSGQGCRLMLIGDTAQLPPVGQSESPALNDTVLEGYHLAVYEVFLHEIARQVQTSGIIHNATMLRNIMSSGMLTAPTLQLKAFSDITAVTGEFLMEQLSDCYDRDGQNETIIITRSNKRAVLFNSGVRNSILYREDQLVCGDMLLVAKNNYFWSQDYDAIDFIANGDIIEVKRVWGEIEDRYGLHFANVTVEFPDHNHLEMDTKIILDCLFSDTPALTVAQSELLFNGVMGELTGDKRTRFKALKKHPYFNALQVKYAYAVTCHKAQGGQWQNVFIDMGGIMPDALSSLDFLRWLYTAITRARRQVYLINCPLETDFR